MREVFYILAGIYFLFAIIALSADLGLFSFFFFGVNVLTGFAWLSVGTMYSELEDKIGTLTARINLLDDKSREN